MSQLAGRIESGMYAPLVWQGEALGVVSVAIASRRARQFARLRHFRLV